MGSERTRGILRAVSVRLRASVVGPMAAARTYPPPRQRLPHPIAQLQGVLGGLTRFG